MCATAVDLSLFLGWFPVFEREVWRRATIQRISLLKKWSEKNQK
jgi:hypothetical protein